MVVTLGFGGGDAVCPGANRPHSRRILSFPFGNGVEHASMYLEQAHEEKPKEDWYACVQFTLVMWNVVDPSLYIHHSKSSRYSSQTGRERRRVSMYLPS